MITRQQHMAESTFRDGETREQHDVRCAAAHRAYYAQFVAQHTIDGVVSRIGKKRLLESTDAHLNDIPLREWDYAAAACISRAIAFESVGDFKSMAGLVCIAKEAAKQWIETQPKRHKEGDTFRTDCGHGRATYRPDWSAEQPYVTYNRGTAGRHFATLEACAQYFAAQGMYLNQEAKQS